jgi:hypothetical protein
MHVRRAAIVLLLTSALAAPVTSAYADVRPSPIAGVGATQAFSPPPSVDAATQEVQRQQQALASESARLAKAAQDATATLQQLQEAKQAAAEAAIAAKAAAMRAAIAGRRTTAARLTLRSYAGSLYRGGMVDPRLLIVTAALSSTNPRQFFNGIGLASQVGNHRAQVLGGLAEAQTEQELAAADAVRTAAESKEATARTAAASAAALKAVAAYRKQVAGRRDQLAKSTATLQLAQTRERHVRNAVAMARAAGWEPTGRCDGKDISRAENGRIPLDALCPLDFTTGQRLRADAAYAFNTMAKEYAAAFGTPLCVTDSYRSLAAQIVVKAEKPELAASPGSSNHGWGVAVDLCGGIESFGTQTHQWMLDNAVLFGWFHPAWAEPSGSKPEAWHWEFAG